MAEDAIRTQVLEHVQASLATYMGEHVPTFNPRKTTWYYTDDYVESAKTPAISIVDKGWVNVEQTCRSKAADGPVVMGATWDRMTVEVRVWLRDGGTTDEKLRAALGEWCGAVKACIDTDYRLGNDKLAAEANQGSNFETIREGTMWFGAGEVTVKVDVFTKQGETAL